MTHPMLSSTTPSEAAKNLAKRAKALRLLKGLKRSTLAERAGVSLSSLTRFERTGKASVQLILKVAFALDRLNEFSKLLLPPVAQSMDELEQRNRHIRKRGYR